MNYLPTEKYSFSGFDLDPGGRVLQKHGRQITVSAKALDILIALVRDRGEVVSKDRLFDSVWPGQFVEENNLTVQISALRKALGEHKGQKEFIVTVSGRGYSFVAPVEVIAAPDLSLTVPITDQGAQDLIGRGRELAEITALLSAGNHLITLTGPGGCGKTRLAAAMFQQYGSKSFFVDLSGIREPELAISTITDQLKIAPSRGRSTIECLANFLTEQPALLVLDNFEQIIAAAGALKEVLEACPQLTIIVTSRAPLRLKSEIEYKVGPLELPIAWDGEAQPGDMFDSAAMRLFMLRARSARHSFQLTADNARVVAEICRKVDGLPLAIELAAARVKVLSPASILDRLARSLDLLTGGGPEVPDRHRTIRDTLAWSYELLTDDERLAFCTLSVFSGGFTVDTAEAIVGKGRTFSTSMLDLVTSLSDWGLVTVKEEPRENVRLGMLEVVREFALNMLDASGEIENVREDHADYFLHLVECAEPHLVSADAKEWTALLRYEIDNIRSAIAFYLEGDGLAAARLAAAARYYWINRSQLIDGCHWLSRALDVSGTSPFEVRFKLLAGLGSFYRLRGEYEVSRQYYRQALAESSAAGRLAEVALATAGIGTVARLEERIDEARSHFEEALDISRGALDKRGISIALNCLADVLIHENNRADACLCLEEALAIYRDLGQSEAECNNLNILGKTVLEDGRDVEAYDYYSRAMVIARSLDNMINTIEALIGFSAIACRAGNEELSAVFSGAAEKLRRSIDYKLEPGEEAFHRIYLERAKARLGDKTFTAAADDGRTLALTKVLDLTGNKLADLTRPRLPSTDIVVETRRTSRIVIEES